MTPEEIDQLADRLANTLRRRGWVPETVRPDPPEPPNPESLPTWAAAAQRLDDVAPAIGRKTEPSPHRPSYGELTAAVRGAAAGTSPSPLPRGGNKPKSGTIETIDVLVAVSARHLHVSQSDLEALFGSDQKLTSLREISQPGQFASDQQVRVVGPSGAIDEVRIVGPIRAHTQVELAASDYRFLGIDAPVRQSGNLQGSAGIKLEGPSGTIDLEEGAIVAARHLHLSPSCAEQLGLVDGDRVDLILGEGDRRCTLEQVVVRAGEQHATELHIDTDEANAFGVTTGCTVSVVGRARDAESSVDPEPSRCLVTEREVGQMAAAGRTLGHSREYIITPAAIDRAKALGIWRVHK